MRTFTRVYLKRLPHSSVATSPLESLAATTVRTSNPASSLILVLTKGGSTVKLVAKYMPGKPISSVVVPEIKTNSFDWTCSDEMGFTIMHAKSKGLCKEGDSVVALHQIGTGYVIKILTAK